MGRFAIQQSTSPRIPDQPAINEVPVELARSSSSRFQVSTESSLGGAVQEENTRGRFKVSPRDTLQSTLAMHGVPDLDTLLGSLEPQEFASTVPMEERVEKLQRENQEQRRVISVLVGLLRGQQGLGLSLGDS